MGLFGKGKLFKEHFCDLCGKKAGALTRAELTDGKCLCFECFEKHVEGVPSYIREYALETYSLENLVALKEYVQYSKEVLAPKFDYTTSYGKLQLDEKNKLFCIEESIFSEPLYYELKNVTAFDLEFKGEEIKTGVLKDTAIGTVNVALAMAAPIFGSYIPVAKKVKARAKSTGVFSNNYVYVTPPEVESFKTRFLMACVIEDAERQESQISNFNDLNEIQKAKALFMYDDDDVFTLEELKKQRNRLIRMYHPDTSSDAEADTRHAQKINNAYEILKKTLE